LNTRFCKKTADFVLVGCFFCVGPVILFLDSLEVILDGISKYKFKKCAKTLCFSAFYGLISG